MNSFSNTHRLESDDGWLSSLAQLPPAQDHRLLVLLVVIAITVAIAIVDAGHSLGWWVGVSSKGTSDI